MSAELNKLTNAIKSRKHPDYEAFVDQWQFFEDTYRGGRQWFDKHIHKFEKEGDAEFAARQKRAYRFNHPKEVVELVGRYLFRGNINRSEQAPVEVKDFWKSCSKRGWEIEEFITVLSRWASVFGRIWVVVDATKLDGKKVKSQSDAKKQNYRVYCYFIRPQDVLDLAYNENDGQLDWVLVRESYRANLDPNEVNTGMRERYRLWTRTESVLYEYDYQNDSNKHNLVKREPNQHDLGLVPIVPLDDQSSSDDYTSSSLIADIAYLDRAVANYLSNLDAIIQDQTFSQLALPAQSAIFGEDADTTKERENMIEVGKKRVFLYDAEGGEPHYMSPDPKQAELIITAIRQIINEIYHSVGVAGERTKQDNSQGIDNSSGVAKAYDFDRINALLTNKGRVLERFENRLCNVVLKYHKKSAPKKPMVTYPETFDTRGFSDELNIQERMEAITTPLEVRQFQLKKVVDKLYPHLSDAEHKELMSAIDEMEDLMDSLVANSGKNGSKDDPSSDALPNEQNQDDGK